MASFDSYKKHNRVEQAKQSLETKRLLWIHRPIFLHERATKRGKCPCCGSREAHRVETITHLDVLIDRMTGERRVRSQVQDLARFDLLCAQAQRIDCPLRCYGKQLAVILDRKHHVIGVFGGNRAGKTTAEAEWMFDQILEKGGREVAFWWVAKSRKKALAVGLRKLIKGEGRTPPIIPRELIVSYPRSVAHDVPALFIDGTQLHFHHASTPDGDNLRGESPVAIVLDEGCTIDHQENWTQLLMRLTDSDGQLLTATTPVLGHYLQTEIRDRGHSYDELDQLSDEDRAKADVVYASLSQRDNPWLPAASVERNREKLGNDELKIRLELDGEWISIGRTLWRHFTAEKHLRSGPWRTVDGWGLVNITAVAAKKFFKGAPADRLTFVGGQDFNVDPCHLVVVQIACHRDLDQSDRRNWIVFVLDEVVKQGTIYEFGDFLAHEAGTYNGRKLPANHFGGMAIACDPSGDNRNPMAYGSGGGTHVKTMKAKGFDCRPCHLSAKGLPIQPPILDRISLGHKLMREEVEFNGQKWPRLVVHDTRCPELVTSIETQLADEKGKPVKVSHTKSDRISGPIDALTYLLWALFAEPEFRSARPRFSSLSASAAP